jgi:hypothetical protein
MSRLGPSDRIAALVMSANATPSLVMTAQEGCAVTAHAGAGLYVITLDTPVDATESVIFVTPRGAVPHIVSIEHTTDATKTINIATNAGVAADIAFDFAVFRSR